MKLLVNVPTFVDNRLYRPDNDGKPTDIAVPQTNAAKWDLAARLGKNELRDVSTDPEDAVPADVLESVDAWKEFWDTTGPEPLFADYFAPVETAKEKKERLKDEAAAAK